MSDTPKSALHAAAASRSRVLAEIARRALLRWPRLDRRALARCAGDVACIAALVSRRTNLPPEVIRTILVAPDGETDRELWFG
ncbi:MAG TPA: hypothetical protein VN800_04765 [Candidatus Acidoferrales bacterium]|nr:hypothetical protein [Candidatus Acidoferrales bacterium]